MAYFRPKPDNGFEVAHARMIAYSKPPTKLPTRMQFDPLNDTAKLSRSLAGNTFKGTVELGDRFETDTKGDFANA
ncbi:hypothetical protein GCM10007047_22780 [Cerasicoccus arenae]|uniref:Uncharacterized protein n=1 Tax=Cerasicoccus arenae TaxID=424488 RepID=A0A8J3GEQ4_9BACT|nr:hypothetical protein GCM10007047_22780 [Cerasicoccus arenae]